jgi:diguanylate cyclase (GGDEF)-like protein
MESPDTLKHLTELAGNVADAFTVALYAWDKDKKQLTPRAHLTLSSDFDETAAITFGKGAVGIAAANGTPILIDKYDEAQENPGIYRKPQGIKSLYAVPAMHEGLQGVLYTDAKNHFAHNTKLQKLLQGFAAQMAWHLHMENRPRLESAGEEALPLQDIVLFGQKLAGATEHSVIAKHLVNLPMTIISCDAMAVVWFDEDDESGKIVAHRGWDTKDINLLRIFPGKGIAGSSAKNRVPLHIGDIDDRKSVIFSEEETLRAFRCRIVAPVFLNEKLFAVIVCASKKKDALGHGDVLRLQLVAAQAAHCIENVRTQRQWEQERNIDSITRLPNHRFLAENRDALETEIFSQNRPRHLLTLQINNLGAIYEDFGMDFGDKVQQHVASLLVHTAPSPRHLFKYTDAAFLLLILGARREDVDHFENRLRLVFEDNAVFIDGKRIPVTVKLGVSASPDDGRTLADLIGVSLSRATQPLKTFS